MSKLALCTSKQMCKIVEKCGFYKVRQKGSHLSYSNNHGGYTVVPMHTGDLKRGLIRNIINDIGITTDEYERLKKDV